MSQSTPQSELAAPSVLSRLRHMTQMHHEALEDALRLDQIQTDRAQYIVLIQRLHALYTLLEQGNGQRRGLKAWQQRMQQAGLSWLEREKLPKLTADLAALGARPTEEHPETTQGPILDHFAAALGCVYVLEGSTLGGQVICRRLRAQLNLTPESGLAFFNGYGPKTGHMWRQIRGVLETQLADPSDLELAVRAAQQTFQLFQSRMAQ